MSCSLCHLTQLPGFSGVTVNDKAEIGVADPFQPSSFGADQMSMPIRHSWHVCCRVMETSFLTNVFYVVATSLDAFHDLWQMDALKPNAEKILAL